jgi:hypothetical protein
VEPKCGVQCVSNIRREICVEVEFALEHVDGYSRTDQQSGRVGD